MSGYVAIGTGSMCVKFRSYAVWLSCKNWVAIQAEKDVFVRGNYQKLPKTQHSVGLPSKGSGLISKFHIRNQSRPPFALEWVVAPTKIPIMARMGWRAGEC